MYTTSTSQFNLRLASEGRSRQAPLMLMLDDWVEGLPVAVTVTAADGTITAMNARSCETFAADGGAALIGKSVFDCHPPAARAESERLYAKPQPNHYTIKKHGQKKIIHQLPWYKNGTFGGVVEISIPIPESLRHFDRDAK